MLALFETPSLEASPSPHGALAVIFVGAVILLAGMATKGKLRTVQLWLGFSILMMGGIMLID